MSESSNHFVKLTNFRKFPSVRFPKFLGFINFIQFVFFAKMADHVQEQQTLSGEEAEVGSKTEENVRKQLTVFFHLISIDLRNVNYVENSSE